MMASVRAGGGEDDGDWGELVNSGLSTGGSVYGQDRA